MADFFAKYTGIFGGGGGGGGGGGSTVKANNTAVTNGANSVSVTFGTAFASTPVVVAWLGTTDGNPPLLAIIETAVSTTGFTCTLSTNVPTANYYISWVATAVADA